MKFSFGSFTRPRPGNLFRASIHLENTIALLSTQSQEPGTEKKKFRKLLEGGIKQSYKSREKKNPKAEQGASVQARKYSSLEMTRRCGAALSARSEGGRERERVCDEDSRRMTSSGGVQLKHSQKKRATEEIIRARHGGGFSFEASSSPTSTKEFFPSPLCGLSSSIPGRSSRGRKKTRSAVLQRTVLDRVRFVLIREKGPVVEG